MKVDDNKIYTMPLIMGPLFDQAERPGNVYLASFLRLSKIMYNH
jgi:hypothetical protein